MVRMPRGPRAPKVKDSSVTRKIKMNVRKGHSFIAVEKNGEKILYDEEGAPWYVGLCVSNIYEPYKVRYIIWECGGGYTNTGESQVICGVDGSPLKPLFIRRRGHLACLDHAAFAVWEGQKVVVIRTDHHRGQFNVRLDELTAHRENVEFEELWEGEDFYIDEIDEVLPNKFSKYKTAIKAAMEKALCYHCREPHYIKEN